MRYPGYPWVPQETGGFARSESPAFPKTDRALTQPFNTPLRGAPFSAPSMLPRARLQPELDLRPQCVSRPRPRPRSASLGPALRAPRSRPALYLWGGGWRGGGLGRADASLKASKLPQGSGVALPPAPGLEPTPPPGRIPSLVCFPLRAAPLTLCIYAGRSV